MLGSGDKIIFLPNSVRFGDSEDRPLTVNDFRLLTFPIIQIDVRVLRRFRDWLQRRYAERAQQIDFVLQPRPALKGGGHEILLQAAPFVFPLEAPPFVLSLDELREEIERESGAEVAATVRLSLFIDDRGITAIQRVIQALSNKTVSIQRSATQVSWNLPVIVRDTTPAPRKSGEVPTNNDPVPNPLFARRKA